MFAYIADCKGKTNHRELYLHFAYVYLDSIRWHLILSCVYACVHLNCAVLCCAVLRCRISEFCEPKIIFAIVSVVARFCAGVGFVALYSNRLHIILNPMFTQFTVHISSVQNPKTNKNTLYLYGFFWFRFRFGVRFSLCAQSGME